MVVDVSPGRQNATAPFACCDRLGGVAQLVVDQPKALAGSEPNTSYPRLLGTDLLRLDVRVEQAHRRIEMRQVRPLLHKLLLKLTHYSGQFRPLVA